MTRYRAHIVNALPVVGIALVAAVGAAIFVLQLVQYVVMPDELTYAKEAVAFSHGNVPTPGDVAFSSWALLRPLLMAPFARWLSPPHAFDAIHVTGALLMASAAWPAYLLTRRATAWRPAALFVAALTVAIPWLAMSGTYMLEVVAYPAFLWAVLAMVDAISRPSWRADLLLVVAIGVAFVARTQLGVLAPAFVLAVVVDALLRRDGAPTAVARLRDALRAHWMLATAAVIVTIAVLASGSEAKLLGSYSTPAHGSVIPGGTGKATHELIAYVVVGIGGLPLAGALAWLATTLGRWLPRDMHALASVTLVVLVVVTLLAGSFTVRFAEGINDRYLFYIAPLLFIGLVAGLAEAERYWTPAFCIAGLVAIVLIWTSALAQAGPSLVSPSMAFHEWLQHRAASIGGGMTAPHLAAIATAVLVAAVAIAGLRATPRVLAAAAGGLVLAFCIAETAYTFDRIADTQNGAGDSFLKGRTWIDDALPNGARAVALLAPFDTEHPEAIWWDTNFWNNKVRGSFRLDGASTLEQGVANAIAIDRRTGRVPALDPYEYIVRAGTDTRFGLRGSTTVASRGAVVVLQAERPYRVNWLITGPDANTASVPAGGHASVRAYVDSSQHSLTVTLGRPADAGRGAHFRVDITGKIARGAIKARARTTVHLPAALSYPGVVDFTVSATDGPVQLLDVAGY